MQASSSNRVIIHSLALEQNYRALQQRVGASTPVMAMVKADGYGHGMVEAAKAFARAGCRAFGVAELVEGVELREAGIKGDIYATLGFDLTDARWFFSHDLIPVIYDLDHGKALAAEALRLGQEIGVVLKIDTGMSRLGIFPGEVDSFLEALRQCKGIRLAGLMSHFPEADQAESESTFKAISLFQRAMTETGAQQGLICHIANSGAMLNFADARFDMVRAGIALYGYDPAGNTSQGPHGSILTAAMEFKSRVLQVKELPPGQGVSYGHTFVTTRKTRVAVIPVGYEDGFNRRLSNLGAVLIKGQLAPVLGRVCMNMSMVDVSEITGVRPGDEVVVMGKDGAMEITAEDIAQRIDTISYEVLCAIGNNNQRIMQ